MLYERTTNSDKLKEWSENAFTVLCSEHNLTVDDLCDDGDAVAGTPQALRKQRDDDLKKHSSGPLPSERSSSTKKVETASEAAETKSRAREAQKAATKAKKKASQIESSNRPPR